MNINNIYLSENLILVILSFLLGIWLLLDGVNILRGRKKQIPTLVRYVNFSIAGFVVGKTKKEKYLIKWNTPQRRKLLALSAVYGGIFLLLFGILRLLAIFGVRI